MDGILCTSGIADETARTLSGGGQRAPGTGSADGSALRQTGSSEPNGGLCFNAPVNAGGYEWWYVDALSDDGHYGLTVIAFIGSVFSPYYAWSGRRDPLNHCAVNVVLYGPRTHHWAMTERRRTAVTRDAKRLTIGPSALDWDGTALKIDIQEIALPFGPRLKGTIRVEPKGLNGQAFALDAHACHLWQPIAPSAHVSLDFKTPDVRWTGDGYFDTNRGSEPLESGFDFWTWSRSKLSQGSAILYDALRRDGGALSLALRFDNSGTCEQLEPPIKAALPMTRWRVKRETRSDDGAAHVERSFEDTPFYSRSLISSKVFGEPVLSVHESLNMSRFSNPIVRCMLPFKMPRR